VFNTSEKVAESTRLKVQLAAEKLDYTPHAGARSLMTKRTDTIGIILPDMYGEFFSEFMKGADLAARELGYHLLISCSHDYAAEMSSALSAMRGRVDGFVVLSPLIDVNALEKHIPKDIPAVVVNGGRKSERFSTVSLDNYTGAFKMTEHLIEEGYQAITLISGPADNQDAEQRKLGYISAMKEKVASYQLDIVEGNFSETSGYEAGIQILSRASMPDAVFCSNDAMAIGCLCAFNEHGISVPQDVALAGFDDIPLACYMRPSLSTVSVPIAQLGSKSIEILVKQLRDDGPTDKAEEYVYSPSLIIRHSSKK
jgi:LacI family transcriptional regulator